MKRLINIFRAPIIRLFRAIAVAAEWMLFSGTTAENVAVAKLRAAIDGLRKELDEWEGQGSMTPTLKRVGECQE